MKPLPIGKDNFKKLIEEGNYYVDKTEVIEILLKNNAEVSLFPRPRRFGKSLFISMLENFFDINKKEENKDLFKDLYIASSTYYSELSKYPIIKLDFKDMKCDTYESFYNQLKSLVSELYTEKVYVKESLDEDELNYFNMIKSRTASRDDYTNSIRLLSKWLERYHNEKVIILIDEYDAPISEAYIKGFYDEAMSMMKKIFSSSLKGNNSVKMGILTGILRVSRESMFSDFNNCVIYDIMSEKYNEYFGFTEEETKELLEYYELKLSDDVKSYYDGYNFGGLSIYNPWSILNYASNKKLIPYWANTSSNLLIKDTLSKLNGIDKIQVEKLLQGESISFVYDDRLTFKDLDQPTLGKTLNLLLISGYLTLDREELNKIVDEYELYFRIPNREVKNELIRIVQDITFNKNIEDFTYYKEFINALFTGDKPLIEKCLNEILVGMSYHDNFEMFYHGYTFGLFGMLLRKNHILKSNRESGVGRFDIMIERIDRSIGVVIELKVADNLKTANSKVKEAEKQIHDKEYYKELTLDKVKDIYEYVFVFFEKKIIVK